MSVGLCVKYPFIYLDCNEIRILWTDIRRILRYQLSWNPWIGSRVVPRGLTVGQTDRHDEAISSFLQICERTEEYLRSPFRWVDGLRMCSCHRHFQAACVSHLEQSRWSSFLVGYFGLLRWKGQVVLQHQLHSNLRLAINQKGENLSFTSAKPWHWRDFRNLCMFFDITHLASFWDQTLFSEGKWPSL
jgi:hypothetical protein